MPYCQVLEDTYSTQCSDVINNPGTCRLKRWTGRFYFEVSFEMAHLESSIDMNKFYYLSDNTNMKNESIYTKMKVIGLINYGIN